MRGRSFRGGRGNRVSSAISIGNCWKRRPPKGIPTKIKELGISKYAISSHTPTKESVGSHGDFGHLRKRRGFKHNYEFGFKRRWFYLIILITIIVTKFTLF